MDYLMKTSKLDENIFLALTQSANYYRTQTKQTIFYFNQQKQQKRHTIKVCPFYKTSLKFSLLLFYGPTLKRLLVTE